MNKLNSELNCKHTEYIEIEHMYIFVLMYLNMPKKSNTINEIKKLRRDVGYILLTQKMFQQINVSKICESIIF